MDETLGQRLRDLRLGGRSFALFSVVSVLAIPVGDFQASDTVMDVFLEMVLGLIATAVLGLYLWPVWAVVSRLLPPGWGRFSVIVAILIGGGVLRGVVVHYLGPVFSFDVDTVLVQRLGNSVATTVVWLIVFSLFTHATDQFAARYDTLMRQVISARQQHLSPQELSKILGTVERELREVVVPDHQTQLSERQLAAVASALRVDVLEKLREHSRGLWVIDSRDVPRLRVLPLLRLALAKLQYSWVFFSLVFGIVGLANVASIIGFFEASWRVGLAVAIIFASDQVYQRVIRPISNSRWGVNAMYLIVVGIMVMAPLGFFEFFLVGSTWSVAYLVLLAFPTALIPVMESTLALSQVARNELLNQLVATTPPGGAVEEGGRSSADLASFLHNSLQSEIHSIIFALEGAANDPTKVALGQSSLERLRLLANRSLDEQFQSFRALPLEHLDQVVAAWRGILEITVLWLPGDEMGQNPRVPTVVQIIQEVASNAVVHGGATGLDVRVSLDGDDFLVTLASNAPDSRPSEAGQGTGWLDSFAVAPSLPAKHPNETVLQFRV